MFLDDVDLPLNLWDKIMWRCGVKGYLHFFQIGFQYLELITEKISSNTVTLFIV